MRAQLERAGHDGAVSPWDWSLGALGEGDVNELVFEKAHFEQWAQLLIDYRDLGGRSHSTAITIVRVDDDAYVYDVRVFENRSVTTVDDAVYPQEGLRDVR